VAVCVAVENDVGVELIVTVPDLDIVRVPEGLTEGVTVILAVPDMVCVGVPEIVFVNVPDTEMDPVCVELRVDVDEIVGRLEGVPESV
jgi:hypothetical protein